MIYDATIPTEDIGAIRFPFDNTAITIPGCEPLRSFCAAPECNSG